MAIDEKKEIDLIEESDRGAVIVAAAILENDLDEILKEAFRANELSEKQIGDLFDLNGPLSSFSSKALICYAFGLISKWIFDDLTTIRRLRNRFAHSPNDVDFLSDEITGIVSNLRCTSEVRNVYKGKRYSVERENLKDWEMRSRGFVKHSKSLFCLGVKILQTEILKFRIAKLKRR